MYKGEQDVSLEDQIIGLKYRTTILKHYIDTLHHTISNKKYKSAKQVRKAILGLSIRWQSWGL